MPLYRVRVEIEFEMLVESEDHDGAMEVANNEWSEEMDNIDLPDFVTVQGEITKLEQIPAEWLGSYAYSDYAVSRTVEEIVAETEAAAARAAAARAPAPNQMQLPGIDACP